MYRLDKQAFKVQSFEEASKTKDYWMKQPAAERWRAAWYLTCKAYGIDPENPPRLDKNYFRIRKHGKETE